LELNEVISRILGRHRKLIAALILTGFLASFLLHLNDAPQYSATARLVLDTSDPTNQAQSAVIADTARAIATGPSLVQGALAEVGARRNVTDVARDNIDVQALGSSGVVQLSVVDPDPSVAVALANAVADAVIKARVQVTAGQAARVVRDLDQQTSQLQKQIEELDGKIDGLRPSASGPRANVGQKELDRLLRQRDILIQRVTQVQTERANVEGTRALRPEAAILDPARLPAQEVPGRRLPDLALGGLLGLLLGIGIAAVIESLRPTLVGRTAIARGIEAPVLAELAGPPERRGHRHGWDPADVAEAAMHVELVAVAAGVQQIQLMALDRQADISNLVQILGDSLKTATVQHADTPSARRRRTGSRPALESSAPHKDDGRIGLILVAPTVVKLADLDPVKEFLAISGWPLLGVIVYQPLRRRTLTARIERNVEPDWYTEVEA
jgi:capsular polysaccharide biosynthesis protein